MRAAAIACAAVAVMAHAMAASGASMEIEAPGPDGPLRGTLQSTDQANAPHLLIIPGSGPTDRDGNSPLGIAAAPYRLIAEDLASAGIASVRIDKRGMFASSAATPDPNAVTIDAYADDVENWISRVQSLAGVSCLWLLGHSEGGLVALVAAQRNADICGVILVAAPGRPLGELLEAQLRANPANAPLLDTAVGIIRSLEQGDRVDEAIIPPALLPLFHPSVQGFLIDAFSFDPAVLIGDVAVPVLIVQGDQDLQVSVADSIRLAENNPSAHHVVIKGMNHVLKSVDPEDVAANMRSYSDPSLPIEPSLVESIVEFVGR